MRALIAVLMCISKNCDPEFLFFFCLNYLRSVPHGVEFIINIPEREEKHLSRSCFEDVRSYLNCYLIDARNFKCIAVHQQPPNNIKRLRSISPINCSK